MDLPLFPTATLYLGFLAAVCWGGSLAPRTLKPPPELRVSVTAAYIVSLLPSLMPLSWFYLNSAYSFEVTQAMVLAQLHAQMLWVYGGILAVSMTIIMNGLLYNALKRAGVGALIMLLTVFLV